MVIYLLGNYGKEFDNTRHNVAKQIKDFLPLNTEWENKFSAQYQKIIHKGTPHWLIESKGYMNLSGEPIQKFLAFYKIEPQELLVVHDDLELSLGQCRYQIGGGLAGHKGLRSIKQMLGTNQFNRMRIGIGRPQHGSVSSYVLGKFTEEEQITLSQCLPSCTTTVLSKL
ncbi:aminoacyl-tRNA hydrolase [Spirochaeta cellobiosiphila]|uniref:aminoacyl-tRNA hydrolase n=1 Tax=Spirochaeta cellobiosiphila TaxID=504483 RepID=UPI00040D3F18|nr:aminoacyl-tRNA hydrolase [Spirochaeta cellobiosiphila]